MPDSQQPHPSRIGDMIGAGTDAARTLAGFTPSQAIIVFFGVVLIGAGTMTGVLGYFFLQQQKELSTQAQTMQRDIAAQLARTIESESEKNRQAIDGNTKLVVASTQNVAMTLGKLQTTLTNLETRLSSLEQKIGKLASKEEEISHPAPMPRRKPPDPDDR